MTVKTELSALSVSTELEEVSRYLNKENLNTNFIQEISEFKTTLENNTVQRLIPVFIPLYQYNPDVCDSINRIIKESNTNELNREYFIFTNVYVKSVSSYTVDRNKLNGIYPSDHHPVASTLTLFN